MHDFDREDAKEVHAFINMHCFLLHGSAAGSLVWAWTPCSGEYCSMSCQLLKNGVSHCQALHNLVTWKSCHQRNAAQQVFYYNVWIYTFVGSLHCSLPPVLWCEFGGTLASITAAERSGTEGLSINIELLRVSGSSTASFHRCCGVSLVEPLTH